MLRKYLLLTTAFVASAASSFLAPISAFAQPMTAGLGLDRNVEFLCTYGQFEIHTYYKSRDSSSYISGWVHVAVPIVGHGKTVSRITVQEEQGSSTQSASFTAGIYGNTRSGIPGKLISGGTGRAKGNCGRTMIAIPPTRLKRKTTYWIVEQVPFPQHSGGNEVYWAVDPHATREAYTQSHYFSMGPSGSSYTTTWARQSMGPYLRVR